MDGMELLAEFDVINDCDDQKLFRNRDLSESSRDDIEIVIKVIRGMTASDYIILVTCNLISQFVNRF